MLLAHLSLCLSICENTKYVLKHNAVRVKKTFGNPDEVVICIGDWEQRKQMKYAKGKEPTLGKGMRTLFRKNNFNVFLW